MKKNVCSFSNLSRNNSVFYSSRKNKKNKKEKLFLVIVIFYRNNKKIECFSSFIGSKPKSYIFLSSPKHKFINNKILRVPLATLVI